jgi:hypothetical protein
MESKEFKQNQNNHQAYKQAFSSQRFWNGKGTIHEKEEKKSRTLSFVYFAMLFVVKCNYCLCYDPVTIFSFGCVGPQIIWR